MQYATDSNENGNIITASNVSKKLSFQGWEKCAEAFSQGKGQLSYRCSQILSQWESSSLDQAISWSSSDEEGEDALSHRTRPRPARTLSSHINFSDCRRVRRGGRRHTSASFVRSIEKHQNRCLKNSSLNLSSHSSQNSNQVNAISNNQDTASRCENLLPHSESHSQPEWIDNLSMLNHRMNLLTGSIASDVENASVADNKSQEDRTSPILVPRETKSIKRKANCISHRAKLKKYGDSQAKLDIPSVCTSPVFKIVSHRRRIPQKSSVQSSCKLRHSSHVDLKESGSSSVVQLPTTVFHSSLSAQTKMLPTESKKIAETAVSPVLGKSITKRRKDRSTKKEAFSNAPAMVVETSISPILGSKTKNPRSFGRATPSVLSKENAEKVSQSFSQNPAMEVKSISESTLADFIPLNKGELESLLADSESTLVLSITSAKRSLDFSQQLETESREIDDTKIQMETLSERTSNDTAPCTIENDVCNNNQSTGKRPAAYNLKTLRKEPLDLNCSQLIEEIYTEQFDIGDLSKLNNINSHLKKKNKLSLTRGRTSKPTLLRSEKQPLLGKVVTTQTSAASVLGNRGLNQNLEQPISTSECFSSLEKQRKPIQEPNQYSKRSINHTLLIEEENSEPMDLPSQDVFALPNNSEKENSPRSSSLSVEKCDKETCTAGVSQSDRKTKTREDVDIDSCSSQSPEGSQQVSIENLPSSCVSSPVPISQTSSPMGPASVGGFAAEKAADDFNAPPKKGKKKLKPDGLANRLQRLLNRQRSSSRIWQYKQSKESKTNSSSAPNPVRNTSILLTIDRTWIEYSHVILQGYIQNGVNTGNFTNASSNHVVVVLDPFVAEKLGKIMSASQIRIFPPWQALKLSGISLILCAYCIELTSLDSVTANKRKTEVCVSVSEGFESIAGISLTDIIFPTVIENPSCLYQYTEADAEEALSEVVEGSVTLGTIAALVSHHYAGGAMSNSLSLSILRAFQFNQSGTDKATGESPFWSLLGRDVSGEVCEIVLGREPLSSSKSTVWLDVSSGQVVGKMYSFTGFLPSQRISPFRVSNLWRVISSMGVLGSCDQPVFYVLAASSVAWTCRPMNSGRKSNTYQPLFTPLSLILSELSDPEPRRLNIICRILHVTNERIYITDTGTTPTISSITLNPTAYLPPLIFKTALISILDLEVSGDLKADKYTRISALCLQDSFTNNLYNEEQLLHLAALNPDLPFLQRTSPAKSLVMFIGTVKGIDEDSAYMWPACGICENELLSLGDNSERYRCEQCNDQCENFILRMSLQVLCSCPYLPQNSSVRLKLLQSTIESLLPPTLGSGEGYDMNAVLGRKLGPIKCEVLNAKDHNFILQELCYVGAP